MYLILAATILGLPYVQKLKGHVNVELVPMLLPPPARKLAPCAALAKAQSGGSRRRAQTPPIGPPRSALISGTGLAAGRLTARRLAVAAAWRRLRAAVVE